ncbi:hypothetical protein PA598K_02895 [Paenibacillus sp. 598K]|uniref:glycosyltransferase n=1 Tax=Paenibacillus sp. 598K TaxID=1117987 RepID=UPI000FF997E5|nr:glycosyltransferase [Paenibacillus sp. 598K]GBF74543.1 hypothetical protein PA598K_02895 [Paenibacillus sp. 598K]
MSTNSTARVLIASPIRQSPDILERFLRSLRLLERGDLNISFMFIDDNDDPLSRMLLQHFVHQEPQTFIQYAAAQDIYHRDENTHYWNDHLVWKVAAFKDQILEQARDMGCDYVFLVDSDLLLEPETLLHLIKADQPIVAEIFWTRWQPDAMAQPQVWMLNEYSQWEQARGESLTEEEKAVRTFNFLEKMRSPGLYQVGGLGACTLIRSDALHKGVSFAAIPNLTFWGEDRHFCVRAAALGIPMYVDTHYPAFHIYRDTDKPAADDFLTRIVQRAQLAAKPPSMAQVSTERQPAKTGITLSMVVHNEEHRYLEAILLSHRPYIDQAVIIDDGSTDRTVDICLRVLGGIPIRIIHNAVPRFSNEVLLRKQQWEETIKASPEWILNLDADEQLEARFAAEIHSLTAQTEVDLFCFRLYDFWNETHYREDGYWQAHRVYRPFLLRYRPGLEYHWKETAQHCGRFPDNVFELPHAVSELRIKHFGWADPQDRQRKLERYQTLDPEAKYGSQEQYASILDEEPRLIEWEE